MDDDGTLSAVIKAVDQTVAIGSKYVAIPIPWWELYCSVGWQYGRHNVDWSNKCMWKGEGEMPPCDDGDVILCLLAAGHEAPCGSPW